MPTEREREYYRMGFLDGVKTGRGGYDLDYSTKEKLKTTLVKREKRKLSAWNKFVKANSKKKIFQYANGKLKLKKMGIAFRKKRR